MPVACSKVAMSLSNDPMVIDTNRKIVNIHQTPPQSPKRKLSISEHDVPTPQRRKTQPSISSSQEEDNEAYAAATILYNAAIGITPDDPNDSELSDEEEDAIANRDLLQKPLKTGETFKAHPTEPNKIIATFRVSQPDGTCDYVQVDEIRECLTTPHSPDNGDVYFEPSLSASKCPRRMRGSKGNGPILWVKDLANNNQWTRTKGNKTETFTVRVLFRRFNATTHKYEYAHYGEKMLRNADPNDREWMYSFNKWLDQITRRRDKTYVRQVQRTHWTVPELRALYAGINAFCKDKGVPVFGFGDNTDFKNADLQAVADAVNKTGTNDRGTDAIRGKVISAHDKKNKAIADLRDRAVAMRAKIAAGGSVEDVERFPEHAIALSEFPGEGTTPGPKKKKRKTSGTGKKSTIALDKPQLTGKGRIAIKEESDVEDDKHPAASPYQAPSLRNGASRKRKRAFTPEDSDGGDEEQTKVVDEDIKPENEKEDVDDSGIAMSDHSNDLPHPGNNTKSDSKEA